VRGLEKNLSLQTLKINLLVSQGELVHVDTLDLYAARARGGFITQAANELRLKEDLINACATGEVDLGGHPIIG
jgi:hypothetical protein